jgi:NAD/NADP transhydrogenase alpha subunit
MVVPNLLKAGLDVVIEAGAGVEAGERKRARRPWQNPLIEVEK